MARSPATLTVSDRDEAVMSNDPASRAPATPLESARLEELLIDAEIDDDAVQAETVWIEHPWVLLAGLMLIGINLRPALSSLAPVLSDVRSTTGLSAAAAGLLTTAPVLCLGVFAPLAPRLANRFDSERVIFVALLVLAAGIALRSLFAVPGLFAGTVLAGASIGVIGVLLPGIVKRDFPERPAIMTGLYTMALCLGAAVAAGVTVPLRDRFGADWRPALAFWAVPAVVAAVMWLPQLHTRHRHSARTRHEVRGLWKDPLAWQVTAYMGLQSSLAYCVFGWFPSILQDRGLSARDAGFMLSVSVMFQLVTALLAPWLATRGKDQRAVTTLMLGLTLAGLLGSLYLPLETIWIWVVSLGLGQGGLFSIALTLIVLRSPDAHVAAHLSGMAQSVGYALAALGPLAVGYLKEWTGGWNAAGPLFAAIAAAAFLAAMGAGRNLQVAVTSQPHDDGARA